SSDGKVGMVGISGFAGEQWLAAAQGHPALKAIFPYDACSAYGGIFGFRDWPLPETQWTKYYLSHWETLSPEPPRSDWEVGAAAREPDVFTQMPVTRTTKIERLRYMTDPLPCDVTV